MNSIEKIEQLVSQLSTTNNNLSLILPQLFPIALECKDYTGFYTLFLWGVPFSNNSQTSFFSHSKEAYHMLLDSGLNNNEINEIAKKAKIDYLNMRGYDISKKSMNLMTAKEMEDHFKYVENIITAIEPPNGLHQVDLYYRSQQATDQKLLILKNNKTVQEQYNILYSFITEKLANYTSILSFDEQRRQNERMIKNTKNIFIVHGHNEAKRRELELILKDRFNLIPIVLSEQPNTGLTIIEKFEKYASTCSYAFAIFTPDDIVSNSNGDKYFQARPNVIFELGWFYAKLGRSRVCIIEQESENSVIFSDLQGVMRVQFKTQVEERYLDIEKELKSVGII